MLSRRSSGRPVTESWVGSSLDRKVVMVFRQMRVEIRIAGDKDMPPFALEHGGVVFVVEGGAADHLVMDQRRVRGIDVEEPALPGAQAIIDIVVDDPVRFVEAAERVESRPPRQQAGAGNGDDVALGQARPK